MFEKWEYCVVTTNSPLEEHELDRFGDDGWELVSYAVEPGKVYSFTTRGSRFVKQHDHKHTYIFKRPKKEET